MFMFGFIISCCWRCIRCLVNRILISSFIISLCLIRIFVVCFIVYVTVYVIVCFTFCFTVYVIVCFIAYAIVSVGLWLYTLLLTSLSSAESLTHSYSPYSYYSYYFYLNSSHFSNFYCHYSNSQFSTYDTLSYS